MTDLRPADPRPADLPSADPRPADLAAEPVLRCSFAADRRGDPMAGTAAPGLGFLLVEQPGPWGRFALTQSRLDPEVGRAVSAGAVAAGLRALLIRRPGREAREPGAPRRWAVVDARPGRESARWGTFDDDADLLDVPLVPDQPPALEGGRPGGDAAGGAAAYAPFFLVCTHGRHDACCAIRGRPVAAALAARRPEQTWECSHVGGDRFAANLLAMPHGLYYGRVDADSVLQVADAHERGEVLPALLRGRSRWLPAAQAAQAHARALYGDPAIGAFEPAGTLPLGEGRWQVRLRRRAADPGAGHLVLTVAMGRGHEPGPLTCHATRPSHPPAFEVTSLVQVP